jgi:hypothetical protein
MSERVVRVPKAKVMTKRLEARALPLKHQGVLNRFVRSIAEQKETGSTLVAAWESACEGANKNLPLHVDLAITQLLHSYAFPSVADAVIPDPEVAMDAKEELRFLEEIRA